MEQDVKQEQVSSFAAKFKAVFKTPALTYFKLFSFSLQLLSKEFNICKHFTWKAEIFVAVFMLGSGKLFTF